jgi:RNA polymerase sigma-70 factor (ECF subfamily)
MSQADKEKDYILVDKTLGGNRRAFDELDKKYRKKIFNLVFKTVKNSEEATEVTQQSFINAYKGLKDFRKDSAFYTWLYRISVNCAKNHITKKLIKVRKIKSLESITNVEELNVFQCLDDPENELASSEVTKLIKTTMDDMSRDLREVLIYREIDQLSYQAISQTMKCPVGTVRSRLFRARKIVDKRIEQALLNCC